MLTNLSISNYALIENQDITFQKGFSIITGETGAGKSILLGALSLILGQRADVSVLNDKTKNCVIEGSFDISRYKIESLFRENDLDFEPHTVIRRIINPSGKTRAFINDLPVNLNVLKAIGAKLVDIHSQHNNILLNDYDFQLLIVDTYAKQLDCIEAFKGKFRILKQKEAELKSFIEKAEKEKAELDFFSFQLSELEKINLKQGEQEDLEQELEQLSHTEEINSNLASIFNMLSGDEINITQNLRACVNLSQQIEDYLPDAKEYSERLDSALIDLGDLATELEAKTNDIVYDPERLEHVKSRLDTIYGLQQKHRVSTLDELLDLQEELASKINNIASHDEQIGELSKIVNKLEAELKKQAEQISLARKKFIPNIEKQIEKVTKELGMPNAKFVIHQSKLDKLSLNGTDLVRFTFKANKQGDLQDIGKVASGGEISRVMLGIKSLISQSIALPTIIFDEIDTGVSGDIADKIGSLIRDMSKNMQVMNITHLPQVAAKGDYHYFVYKKSGKTSTTTKIKLLTNEERITEIAKMLSGKELTEAALSNAKVLLAN